LERPDIILDKGAEFTYNNMSSSTTGIFFFFANKSYYPSIQIQMIQELASQLAKIFMANLEKTHIKLKQAITKAQKCY